MSQPTLLMLLVVIHFRGSQ